jgi:hypothetical protein
MIPSNLKPIEQIFKKKFSGLYYNERDNQFYSRLTNTKSKTFQPIKWRNIKYYSNKIDQKKENDESQYKTPTKIYKYITLPAGDGTYYRLSEKSWKNWAPKANINISELSNKFGPENEIYVHITK